MTVIGKQVPRKNISKSTSKLSHCSVNRIPAHWLFHHHPLSMVMNLSSELSSGREFMNMQHLRFVVACTQINTGWRSVVMIENAKLPLWFLTEPKSHPLSVPVRWAFCLASLHCPRQFPYLFNDFSSYNYKIHRWGAWSAHIWGIALGNICTCKHLGKHHPVWSVDMPGVLVGSLVPHRGAAVLTSLTVGTCSLILNVVEMDSAVAAL